MKDLESEEKIAIDIAKLERNLNQVADIEFVGKEKENKKEEQTFSALEGSDWLDEILGSNGTAKEQRAGTIVVVSKVPEFIQFGFPPFLVYLWEYLSDRQKYPHPPALSCCR